MTTTTDDNRRGQTKWTLPPPVPPSVRRDLDMTAGQAQLLYNRGISTRAAASAFLNPSESDLLDPMALPDMGLASERLRKAVRDGESVGVFGDFDIDGISGTAVAALGLRELGADVIRYLPHRDDEGHGLNETAVRSLADRGATVLVTVDCGATSDAEIALARSLGVDCVITDHHAMFNAPSPDAAAMVNPKRQDSEYPYEDLTGAGLAYKLMQAVCADAGRDEPRHLLELAALGTVGDVGTLIGENRYFVSEGLRRMNAGTRFAGLRALMEVAGLDDGRELDTASLSFQIIPRLNAAGRVADPGVALDLLLESDPRRANGLARKLDEYNVQRRRLTEEGMERARAQVRERWGDSPPAIIMVGDRNWKPGVLGLIASRLVDAYGKPAIAVSVGSETSRASARSVEGFDIVSAIEARSDLLIHFGGHAQAAGFGALNENMRELAAHFETYSDQTLDADAEPTIALDMRASPSFVESELFGFIQDMKPYGAGCPQPSFASDAPLEVAESRAVGAGGKHLKLRLREAGGKVWDAIAFGLGARGDEAPVGAKIQIAYRMETNYWNGRETRQLVTVDFGGG